MCYLCDLQKSGLELKASFGFLPGRGPGSGGSSGGDASLNGATTTTDALIQGYSWSGTKGQAVTVTYSFGTSVEGGSLLNASQQSAVLSAMAAWSAVANVTFVAVNTSEADLTFSQENLGTGVYGLTTTYYSGTQINSAEVQIDDEITDLSQGSLGYLVLLHELGHALGLKHTGNYSSSDSGTSLSSDEDNIQNSVMSYYSGDLVDEYENPSETPMIYDIAALQELYGANTTTNSGNTTYTLGTDTRSYSIWDSGGTDIVNASSLTSAVTIDLREGADYIIQAGGHIVLIVEGANLEQARGGTGNDHVSGNDLSNILYGGNGSDTLDGTSGDDIICGGDAVADNDDSGDEIYGGSGNDALYGNSGNDALYGGQGVADSQDGIDKIYGGKGSDLIYGNSGDDTLYGGGNIADPNDYADTIYGGTGSDQIYGNGGNDFIAGLDSNDTLYGGQGDDTYYFDTGSGNDVIAQFIGAGEAGGDIISLASDLNGSGITGASAALAAITYFDDYALMDLGNGNSLRIEGVTAGLISVSDLLVI